jgi:hypothetical protein
LLWSDLARCRALVLQKTRAGPGAYSVWLFHGWDGLSHRRQAIDTKSRVRIRTPLSTSPIQLTLSHPYYSLGFHGQCESWGSWSSLRWGSRILHLRDVFHRKISLEVCSTLGLSRVRRSRSIVVQRLCVFWGFILVREQFFCLYHTRQEGH